jgi:regulator of protease activity HflC (stomatin/prohibitin superfamily)
LIGVLATGVSVGKASVYYVNTGEKAFKFNKVSGVRETTYKEGYHLKAPWFEREIIYNVKS